jgi:hypothetical protein
MIEAEEGDEEDDEFDDDEAVKIFRRQKVDESVQEAVSRVLSMVDSPEARMQYRRMLEEVRQATVSSLWISFIMQCSDHKPCCTRRLLLQCRRIRKNKGNLSPEKYK